MIKSEFNYTFFVNQISDREVTYGKMNKNLFENQTNVLSKADMKRIIGGTEPDPADCPLSCQSIDCATPK